MMVRRSANSSDDANLAGTELSFSVDASKEVTDHVPKARIECWSPTLLTGMFLPILLSSILPKVTQDVMVAWSCSNAVLLILYALWNQPISGNRYPVLDMFRGVVLQHIVIFHVTYDLGAAKMIHRCEHAISEDSASFYLDYPLFIAVLFGGHILMILWGGYHPWSMQLYFTGYSCFMLITWQNWSSRVGMTLMTFTAGYTSMHLFERAERSGKLREFAWRSLHHIAVLGSAALAITAVTYLRNPRGYSCTGAIHLLFFAYIVHIPFLKAPYLAFAVGSVGLVLQSIFGINFWQPLSCGGGFDHQNFQLGLAGQIFGVGACRLHFFLGPLGKFLEPNMDGLKMFVWMGQHTLKIYLAHQALLFPMSKVLGFLWRIIGMQAPQRWCYHYDVMKSFMIADKLGQKALTAVIVAHNGSFGEQ